MSDDENIRKVPTGELRWRDGALEQKMEIHHWLSSVGCWRIYKDWQPVPTVKTEDGNG